MQQNRPAPASLPASTQVQPSQEWTRTEKIDGVGILANGLSALAALAGTIIAVRGLRSQDRLQRSSTRHAIFTRLVIEPALENWIGFGESASASLVLAEQSLKRLVSSNAGIQSIKQEAALALDEFRRQLQPIENALLRDLRTWQDSELLKAVSDRIERLDDDVSVAIEAIRVGGTPVEALSDIVNTGSSEVIALVVHHPCESK
jgi:hypothetical protein